MPLLGFAHVSLVVATIAAAAALSWLCQTRRAWVRPVRLALGYGITGNELVWWVFRYSREGIHLNNLPLQLCDLTVWLTVVACLTLMPTVVECAYFAGVAGSGMAILTPNLWSPWPSYPAVYFFLAHGGVLVGSAALTFGRIVVPRPGAIRRVFGILAVYAALIGAFNAVFGSNYMYLRHKPANPSLLDWLGPWPLYLASGMVVALLLFWLLWLPFRPPVAVSAT